jgi:hypothetical protein
MNERIRHDEGAKYSSEERFLSWNEGGVKKGVKKEEKEGKRSKVKPVEE